MCDPEEAPEYEAAPEYEEVLVVVEQGPEEAEPHRFWRCSRCSGLLAGTSFAAVKLRHDRHHGIS